MYAVCCGKNTDDDNDGSIDDYGEDSVDAGGDDNDVCGCCNDNIDDYDHHEH
jgi:hypothetical protein